MTRLSFRRPVAIRRPTDLVARRVSERARFMRDNAPAVAIPFPGDPPPGRSALDQRIGAMSSAWCSSNMSATRNPWSFQGKNRNEEPE